LFDINGTVTQVVTCAQNDGEITLNPEPNGAYTFVWQHDAGNSNNIASAIPDGSYFVTVSDGICQKDTTIILAAPVGCCTIVLDGNLSTTTNTVCDGTSNPCNYSGPTILINEINIFPSNGDGSIFGDGPSGPGSGAGEWIELYNPDWCNSVDISGYILGSFNSTFSINPPLQSDGMGFVLPDGLIVPPNGFVVVRGINTNAPPAGVIDVVVDNVDNRVCIEGGITDSRIWFQNAGGWFGFYDANGVPQDMIRWNSPTASDLDGRPCIPTTNSLPGGVTQLPSFNEAGINNILGAPSLGQTFVRIPDGGAWSATTQNENSSYGACHVPGGCNGNGGAFSTCNGSATLNVTNGQAPYTYLWNDDLAQDTPTADSLCAGTYSVVVSDANGCSSTFDVTVDDEFLTISATSINPTCANNNGTIDVVATPNGVYDYTWSANANVGNNTTTNVSTLAADTYTISVSSPTCVRDTTITLSSPPQITDIATNVTSSLCAQNNGAVQLGAVTGGTSPFSYNFNNQGSGLTMNFTSLSAGNYDVVVEDANGCSYQEAIVVSDDSSNPPTQAVFDNLDPSCLNNDGQIEISNVIGGVAPYSYQLNGAASTTTAIFAALASGNYAINIEDANGCSMIANTVLTAPPAITDLATTVTNSTCAQNNGQVLLGAVSGGTQPFTYNFNNQGSSTNQSFSDLVAGSYPVTVQDANLCTYQETIVVVDNSSNPPTQANFEVINPGCGQSNGEIEILSVVGGVAPYSYQFNNGVFSTNTNYANLGLGSYSLIVEDADGCQFETDINITTAIGNENVVIPNVFTPSDDLVNQEWQIKGECVQTAKCQIFNRWGNLIHEFNDINGKWDGKTNGDQVHEGVYFYKLIVTYSSGLVVDYHGNITVIRD
jgi:gliding motility-associated-like protein